MDAPIKERRLSTVSISNIDLDFDPDKKQVVGTICQICLTNQDGGESGPTTNVLFGLIVDPSTPLRDVSRSFLERAHEILERMASFSVDDLERCFVQGRAEAAAKAREASSMGYPKEKNA